MPSSIAIKIHANVKKSATGKPPPDHFPKITSTAQKTVAPFTCATVIQDNASTTARTGTRKPTVSRDVVQATMVGFVTQKKCSANRPTSGTTAKMIVKLSAAVKTPALFSVSTNAVQGQGSGPNKCVLILFMAEQLVN